MVDNWYIYKFVIIPNYIFCINQTFLIFKKMDEYLYAFETWQIDKHVFFYTEINYAHVSNFFVEKESTKRLHSCI